MVTISRQTNGPNWSNILTDSVVIDQNIQIRVNWKGLLPLSVLLFCFVFVFSTNLKCHCQLCTENRMIGNHERSVCGDDLVFASPETILPSSLFPDY